MIYLRLIFEFFKTGLFTVGGGLATLPFLYEISNKTGWFSHTDIADMIAVSESTPGAIGINMSTYAGYTTGGVPGGILATLSLAAPSVIIILIIAHFLNKFQDSPYVKGAFYGLRPASIAMISAAGINVAKVALLDLSAFSETRRDPQDYGSLSLESGPPGNRDFYSAEVFPKAASGDFYRFVGSGGNPLSFCRSLNK